jgi:phosphoglycerate dehydrogenase-like enzyme
MNVIGIRRTPSDHPLYDQVLASSELNHLLGGTDFLVVSCPLTGETRGMFGLDEFRRMKRSAFLVNIARGAVVREEALIQALSENLIAGAAVDVFDQEPLPADSPLWDQPNLLLTPHSSFRSPTFRQRSIEEFATNLELFLADRPLNNPLRDFSLGY